MPVPALLGGVVVGQSVLDEQAVLGAEVDANTDGMVHNERDKGGTLIGRANGRLAKGKSIVDKRTKSSVGLLLKLRLRV